jgi:hypothetical protein
MGTRLARGDLAPGTTPGCWTSCVRGINRLGKAHALHNMTDLLATEPAHTALSSTYAGEVVSALAIAMHLCSTAPD